jgi:hypothetical protein
MSLVTLNVCVESVASVSGRRLQCCNCRLVNCAPWGCKRTSVVHIIFVILYSIFCTWVTIRGDLEHKNITIPLVLWFVNVINTKYHSASSFSALFVSNNYFIFQNSPWQ